MNEDMDKLLAKLRALTEAAKEPGRLSREQIEEEVNKATEAVQELLTRIPTMIQPPAGISKDVFQAQLMKVLTESGLTIEKTQEVKKLTEELELLKRTFIRS